jgi:hypothetical protein
MPVMEIHGDPPAHREAAEMGAIHLQPVDDAQQVGAEIAELERPAIIARAIAARVPGGGGEMLGEDRELVAPVAAIAADAVKKEEKRAAAGDVDGDVRMGTDAERGGSRQIDRLSCSCQHSRKR